MKFILNESTPGTEHIAGVLGLAWGGLDYEALSKESNIAEYLLNEYYIDIDGYIGNLDACLEGSKNEEYIEFRWKRSEEFNDMVQIKPLKKSRLTMISAERCQIYGNLSADSLLPVTLTGFYINETRGNFILEDSFSLPPSIKTFCIRANARGSLKLKLPDSLKSLELDGSGFDAQLFGMPPQIEDIAIMLPWCLWIFKGSLPKSFSYGRLYAEGIHWKLKSIPKHFNWGDGADVVCT